MRKFLNYKILASVLAASILSTGGIAFAEKSGIENNPVAIGINQFYIGEKGSSENKVKIDEYTAFGVVGGYHSDKEQSVAVSDNVVEITNAEIIGSVYGGYSFNGGAVGNQVSVNGNSTIGKNVYGGYSQNSGDVSGNLVTISHGAAGFIYGGESSGSGSVSKNTVTIEGSSNIKGDVMGGKSSKGDVTGNTVSIKGGSITGNVYGGLVNKQINMASSGNKVEISGGTINGKVYGGESAGGRANENTVTIKDAADIAGAELWAKSGKLGNDNVLNIENWSGSTKTVRNFNIVNFNNTTWENGKIVLNITDNNSTSGALAATEIKINKLVFAGGAQLAVGDSMTFISGNQGLGIKKENVSAATEFTAGVAMEGTGEVQVADDQNSVSYTLTSIRHLDQINLIAENRAVAAAFVNQGTDLISNGLDAMNRDGNYGIKTFAAVHGNRSQYDVNSDLKINGWSTIVGVGSERKLGSGDFLWGIFYENGSGNYRTYNTFNNEFFRGDGSLLYNGGGIAARFEKDNGIYAEGSLRTGTLKSEMTNALRDGAGNSYGYESESTYYGAHIGAGKIFSVNETTDVDVYGKFFHTYTEGDRFAVAGDVFEFDGVTSNRLRIGSRVTTNKEDRVNLYYGLAYEYEFSGDAHMRAQGMSVPEQSLKGSSYMAEVGMNYKPGKTSPWGFDLNIRGYAGQREGVSCSVLTSYTF